ncbi:hypothetical protein PAPYR_6255 [Paratrimastix pyriformis]|uniref:RNase H type-1 domain-containing protein n=1 Tax=Paratrimastix pyriformis TaxID=342808 RepID=A0ABQ8ULD9_9EUKA|nr:hypothetical protein PAPYR_6255 [Paratrimastix pyriformis]
MNTLTGVWMSDRLMLRVFIIIGLTDEQVHVVLATLLKACQDYATDSRGDVGGWVREASLKALLDVTRQVAADGRTDLLSEQECTACVASFLQQGTEKLDRLRRVSLSLLFELLPLLPAGRTPARDLLLDRLAALRPAQARGNGDAELAALELAAATIKSARADGRLLPHQPVAICADSQYALGAAAGWTRIQFAHARVLALREALQVAKPVVLRYVPAHVDRIPGALVIPSIPGNQLADRLAEAARLGGPPDRGGIQATFPTQELCGPIGPAQWPSGPAESPLPFSHKFLTRSLLTTLARLAHEEEEARDWLACPYAYHPLEPISARVSNTWWTRRGEPLSTVRKLCAAKCQAFWGVNQRHDQVLRALARALTAAGLKVVVHDSAANARKATQIPEELQARIPAHLRHLRPDLLVCPGEGGPETPTVIELAVTTAVRDEDLAKARDGKLAQYRGYCQAAGFDNRALLFGATGCIPGQSVRDLLQLVPGTEHKTLCEALRRISGDLTRSILALFLMRDSDRRDRASTQIHRPAAAPSGFLHPPLRHLHGSP